MKSKLLPLLPLALLLLLSVSVFFVESYWVLFPVQALLLLLHLQKGLNRATALLFGLMSMGLPWMLPLFWIAGYEQTGEWRAGFVWGLTNMLLLLLRLLILITANLYVIRVVPLPALTGALSAIGLPEKAVLFFSTLLRFIPLCSEEARRIIEVQRCREFNPRRLFYDPRALLPLFVPLFVGQMKKAHDLALSLEIRHGAWKRADKRKEQNK